MKRVQLLEKISPLCLIIPLLLSACRTTASGPELTSVALASPTRAGNIDPTKSVFPLTNYPQSVDKWIPLGSNNAVPFMTNAAQLRHLSDLKSHYFGMGENEESPWNPYYIASVLGRGAEADRDANIKAYLGEASISWGENFRVHPDSWKQSIRNNAMTDIVLTYQPSRRAITVRETLVRALPTIDPAYSDPRKAGQGYPFDNLQVSAIRPATPVYVIAVSRDSRWKYVLSPTVIGWVRSEDIAEVDRQFVAQWLALVDKNVGAFIKEPVTVNAGAQYYFTARPGTLLPFKNSQPGLFDVSVPVRKTDGHAQIRQVTLQRDVFVKLPWKMTPGNMAILMKSMAGKPYGWGNYNFYNDCSAEIRSLMMPFGIFLPRNSAAQVRTATRVVDLSKENTYARLRYLTEHGKPFTTLVHIQGHIMLYIGNTIINGQTVPMTYQNLWGLRPADSKSRSIIGGSVFLPLLASYPEDPRLMSLAGGTQFELGFIE